MATKTVEQHPDILGKLMDRISEYNLEIKLKKCIYLENKYVNKNGIAPF